MRFHTAVNKFIWQAINGQPLSVWKTAWQQQRPYLDLRDCVAAVSLIIERNVFDGEIYNVVTANFTVEQIVTAIKQFIPSLTVDFVDSPIMNQLSYNVSDKRFTGLGFKVEGSIDRRIGDTIALLRGAASARL